MRGREIACAHAGRGKLIVSGIWLGHESRLSSELELFANSKLSQDSSVRREDWRHGHLATYRDNLLEHVAVKARLTERHSPGRADPPNSHPAAAWPV
jgi:hypothetical protein